MKNAPKGVEKIPTGVAGFDAILRGEHPIGKNTVIMGEADTEVVVRDFQAFTEEGRREEEARQRTQIELWEREIELMSAQLLADKLALTSLNGSHTANTAVDIRQRGGTRPKGGTSARRKAAAKRSQQSGKRGGTG